MASVNNKENSEISEIKNELLCYIQNHFGNSSKAALVTTVTGFYNHNEICAAKHIIFQTADKLHRSHGGKQHRMVIRKGDNRKSADAEDILNLLSDLDVNKIELPLFTAADLRRIPPFVPDATDICTLTMSVSVMQAQLADLRMAVTRLTTPTVVATPDTSANTDESAAMPT